MKNLLKASMFLLVAIGIGMVIRRSIVLAGVMPTNNKSLFASFDRGFDEYSFATILHIFPGALFMISGMLQFMNGIRLRHIQFHRVSGKIFILAAYVVGISSIVLIFTKQSIGGIDEDLASLFFSVFLLVSISLSWYYISMKKVSLHREWMIRAFSIGLAIATIRLIVVFAFLFFGVSPENFLGTAFWIGFNLHAIVAEIWIHHTRKRVVDSL